MLWRYIDDGLTIHRLSLRVEDLNTFFFCKVYPPHLSFTLKNTASRCGVALLEIWVVPLAPLRTSGFWKKSHACTYIPWRANQPRHIKCSWVRGECIRYLRICSHECFYTLGLDRLITALKLLDYPNHVVSHMVLYWQDRANAIIPRRQRLVLDGKVICSLSQAEHGEAGVSGGGNPGS